MDYSIGIRLKEYRLRTGIKMPEIEKATGILKHNLYKWEQGAVPRHSDDFIKLRDYLEKMEEGLTEKEPSYESHRTATLKLPLDPNKMPVSQVSGKAAAGSIIFENTSLYLIVDRIDAPFLEGVEGVVEITTDSMEPTFKKGWRIGLIRLKDQQLLHWGEYYFVIDKNGQGGVKRLYNGKTDGCILLVSDNPDKEKYPSIELNQDQIVAILKVKVAFLKF